MRPPYFFRKWAFYLGVVAFLFELLKTLAIIVSGDPRNSPQFYWFLFIRGIDPTVELITILLVNILLLCCCFFQLRGGTVRYRSAFQGLILAILSLSLASSHFLVQIFNQYKYLSSLSTLEKEYHLSVYLSMNGESEYLVYECRHWNFDCQTHRVAYLSDKSEIKNAKLTYNAQVKTFAIQTTSGVTLLTNSDGSWPQISDQAPSIQTK
jgi:hypothetical protein